MSKVKWTGEQSQAIHEKGSNILVAAAAGSGKTAVLVERIINKIISQISLKIQDKIDNTPNRDIYIRLGSFTGIKLLSGRGPKVPIRISSIGNINTEVMSEFTSTGINQSIHRIFTNITCKIEVLTPFNTISNEIEEKIILAENVIIGNIPENYLDIGKLLGENN